MMSVTESTQRHSPKVSRVRGTRYVAKVPGFGAGGPRFESFYDLVKDHLPVKLALQALT